MTTTEDPYVRVEREDLAVGMRFDYRLPDEPWDAVERTLTALDPIAYDSGNVGHVTLNPSDDITSEHQFYVHRDDITLAPTRAPAENAPEAASSVEERVDQECAQTRAEQVAHAATAGYEEGLRDGYAKAQAEQVTEARTKPRRKRFTREDAVVLAIQAVGGGEHAMSVVSMASSIEQYVNGDERPTYPHPDGETIVLGPGVFASEDRAVLNWDGVNYVQQIKFPDVIETAEQAALDWPAETLVKDSTGDTWVRASNGNIPDEYNDGWTWAPGGEGWTWAPGGERRKDMYLRLRDYLPATVTRLGAGA